MLVANVAQFIAVNLHYFNAHSETKISREKYNLDLDLNTDRWRGSLPSMVFNNHQ